MDKGPRLELYFVETAKRFFVAGAFTSTKPEEYPFGGKGFLIVGRSTTVAVQRCNKARQLQALSECVLISRLDLCLLGNYTLQLVHARFLVCNIGLIPLINVTTTVLIVKTEEIYTINTAWQTTFFVTAIAMLAASILGAVFCHSSITPEILGFASIVIRDSKYVDLAPGFGALGGLEMTNSFEKIEFRYGVVNKSDSGQEVMGVSWKVSTERVKKRVPYV